jgi:hypothetical protein
MKRFATTLRVPHGQGEFFAGDLREDFPSGPSLGGHPTARGIARVAFKTALVCAEDKRRTACAPPLGWSLSEADSLDPSDGWPMATSVDNMADRA